MEEKNHINKKGRISLLKILIVAVALLILIMIYMGTLLKSYNSETTNIDEAMEISEEIEHPEFNYAKIYPDKEYVFQKEVVSNDDSDVSYSLVLPFINLNIKEAQELNSKLEKYYNKNKAYYNDEKIGTDLPELSYDYSYVGDILNLKIIYFVGNNNSICEDYHIDVKNGKFLSRDEFLKVLRNR